MLAISVAFSVLQQVSADPFSQLIEKKVSDSLDMSCLFCFKHCLVFLLVSFWLHLKNIRVWELIPEPVRRSKLNGCRIDFLNFGKGMIQFPPIAAVFYAKCKTGNPVSYRILAHRGNGRKRTTVLRGGTDEMSETTLQRETEREFDKSRDSVHDWRIDGREIQDSNRVGSVLLVSWIEYS